MDISILISFVLVILTIFYIYSKWIYSYWKNRNVYCVEPVLFYGNFGPVMKQREHMSTIFLDVYKKAKARGEKYCGVYAFLTPEFVPIDMELIKCILQKDFVHFMNHGFYVDEQNDPLTGHLFNLEGEKWRNLRTKFTPTFTSGKMKMMFQTMVECTGGLEGMLKESSTIEEPIDIKEILSRFTTDVIGSVAFGLEINSMKNPDSEFRKYGAKIFTSTLRGRILFSLINLIPFKSHAIIRALGLKFIDKNVTNFFINLVKDTIDYRMKNKIYRKDFMHMLIQLRNIGQVIDGSEGLEIKDNEEVNNKADKLTINQVAAQAFVFFIAGFETSATTMTFALLELSQNQDIQEKVREEIRRVLKKHDDKITYEALAEMEYLEKVVLETLRKHPPVSILPRVCTKDYKIPDSDLLIKKGTKLRIPIIAIHHDPEYYPDPEKFDPERFSEEAKSSRPTYSYMPFGEGPRICIGLRFGKLQAKVGLCAALKNYRVTLNEKTTLPVKYDRSFVSSVRDGVWVNLEVVN